MPYSHSKSSCHNQAIDVHSDSVDDRRYLALYKATREKIMVFVSATAEQLAKIEVLKICGWFNHGFLNDSLWQKLYSQLRLCHNLHTLFLNQNNMYRIEQNKILELFRAIAECPIVKLDCSDNDIAKAPTGTIKTIFDGIGLLRYLRSLNLADNYFCNLTGELREHFYNIIINLPSLHELQLITDLDVMLGLKYDFCAPELGLVIQEQKKLWQQFGEMVTRQQEEIAKKKITTMLYIWQTTYPTLTAGIKAKILVEADLVAPALGREKMVRLVMPCKIKF